MDTTDQYGNPVGQTTDAYGNPVHGGGVDAYGNPVHGGAHQQPQMTNPAAGTAHRLHRSGSSSSSSSSEDDGMGGRRKKKGMKEKIKEKLPGTGGHKTDEHTGYGTTTATTGTHPTTTTGYGATTTGTETHPEKKGMMEKIKEKLPGHH